MAMADPKLTMVAVAARKIAAPFDDQLVYDLEILLLDDETQRGAFFVHKHHHLLYLLAVQLKGDPVVVSHYPQMMEEAQQTNLEARIALIPISIYSH